MSGPAQAPLASTPHLRNQSAADTGLSALSAPAPTRSVADPPALSMQNEVLGQLAALKDRYALLLLRPARRSPEASPSEQPFLANERDSGMACVVFVPKGAQTEPGSREPVIIRGDTIHSHMIKHDPSIAQALYGDKGLIRQALSAGACAAMDQHAVAYVDPYGGLPGNLPTAHDRVLYLGPGRGYEVLAVIGIGSLSLSVDYIKQESLLLKNIGPQSALKEKEAALAYLRHNPDAQYQLMLKIEPFYLTSSTAPVTAKHGQFEPHFVLQYLGEEAQMRAYNMGMIRWPEKFIFDESGRRYYTKEFVETTKEFHRNARHSALKLLMEREYSFLPQETAWYELGKYNTTVQMPRAAQWAADKGAQGAQTAAQRAAAAASGAKTQIDEALRQAELAVLQGAAEIARKAVSEGSRKLYSDILRRGIPHLY